MGILDNVRIVVYWRSHLGENIMKIYHQLSQSILNDPYNCKPTWFFLGEDIKTTDKNGKIIIMKAGEYFMGVRVDD